MKQILIIALAIAMFGCAKDRLPEVETIQANQSTELTTEEALSLQRLNPNHLIPENEIVEQAKLLASTPNSDSCQLKSGSEDEVFIANSSKIWCKLSDSNLKSGNSKTTQADSLPLHIFNFSNAKNETKGFVIISGDRRLPGVLAHTENGSINDTATNPGLAIYMSLTREYLKSKLAHFNDKNDSVLVSAMSKIKKTWPENLRNRDMQLKSTSYPITEIRNRTETSWTVVEKYGNWLKTTWDQNYPYNKLLTPMGCVKDGQPYPVAGCTAIAIAQVLAFHKWPASLDGYTYNWDIMTETPDCGPRVYYVWSSNWWRKRYDYTNVEKRTADIANLIKTIGYRVSMQYTCAESGANAIDVIPWITQNSYSCGPMKYENYNLAMHMKHAQPYVIRASDNISGIGHAWVLDGYTNQQRTVSFDIVTTFNGKTVHVEHRTNVESQQLVHCNWGAGGHANGDFATGALNVTGRDNRYYSFNTDVELLGFWPIKPL